MLVKQVEKTIEKYGLLQSGDKILVAVSGGADSVALLHVLLKLRPKYRWLLHVAHLDHSLRGRESDRDADFVRRLAQRLKVPFTGHKADVSFYARKAKLSIEQAARELRYEFLNRIAASQGLNKIAIAHNANDQVETILLFLVRGSGKSGLSGMPLSRDNIVRPLLECWRPEIEKYLRENKIPFRTDSTNLETDFLRNRIRLRLLPSLAKEYNSQIYRHIFQLGEIERQEDAFLRGLAFEQALRVMEQKPGRLVLKLGKYLLMEDWLQRRVIRSAGNFSYEEVEKIRELARQTGPARELQLAAGLRVQREYGQLFFYHAEEARDTLEKEYILEIPGKNRIAELKLAVHCELYPNKKGFKAGRNNNQAFLDADAVKGRLHLRRRRAGDRFQPYGLKGTMKVKDYLISRKVPLAKRGEIPVITDDKKIVWLAGLGRIDDRVKITTATKNILKITVTKERA
jgi:tRNA(Ile)-lysidine synthase